MISATNRKADVGQIVSNPRIWDAHGNEHNQPLRVLRISNYHEWFDYSRSIDPNFEGHLEPEYKYFYEISVD